MAQCAPLSKPEWIRIKPPSSKQYFETRELINKHKLHTVCQEAMCPNISECWSGGTATIMILGERCTRGCRFCNVKTGNPQGIVDKTEPKRVASQLEPTPFKYVVLTCVDRDDLPDGGAFIFADTVREIKALRPDMKLETLISDYQGDEKALQKVVDAHPEVIAHNVETVEQLTPKVRDHRASYRQSLQVLENIKKKEKSILSKSSLMVGLGETIEELLQTARDMRSVGVDILTYGQYLSPSKRHLKVERYYTPSEFKQLEEESRKMGFLYVASGPLVRSSYRAAELFIHGHLVEQEKSA